MANYSNQRIIKNTAFLYVRMVVVMIISLYTSRLILQTLGVDDYGLYNVVGGIVLLFSLINNALSAGTSRFITFELGRNDKDRLRNTFSAAFFIHLAVAVFVLILTETIGLWYVNNIMVVPPERLTAANYVYQFSIVTCMLSLTQVPYSAAIIAHEKMSIYAWVGIADAVAKLVLLLLLVYVLKGDNLILYGLIIMLVTIGMQVFYRFYCHRYYEESKLLWVKDKSYYKSMLSFSLWDIIGATTIHGYSQGVNLLMNYFFSLSVNAAKGVAYKVQHYVNLFSSNYLTATRPQIVKLFAEGNIDKMKKLVVETSKISFYLLAIVAVPLFIETEYVLNLWLTEVPELTALFLRLIIVVSMMRSFATPIVHAVHATGNIKQLNLYSGGASLLLNLPLTYLAYILGAPAEYTFYILIGATLICNYIELLCLKREIGFNIIKYTIDVYLRSMLVTIPAFAVSLLLCHFVPSSFLRLILVSFFSILLLLGFAYCFGISERTKEEINSIIKKKIGK